MKLVIKLFPLIFVLFVFSSVVAEEHSNGPKRLATTMLIDDPRGEVELTICSLNLNNFGTYEESVKRLYKLTLDDYQEKLSAIVKRFAKAKCDSIAVQELLAKSDEEAATNLGVIAKRLQRVTGRIFDVYPGQTNDPLSRVGFLIARDRATVQNIVTYNRLELPKLMPKEKPRFFIRGPLEIQLSVKGIGDSVSKLVTLVTYHFKSKAGKGRDPAELDFETYRMQMAEGLRRVIENRHAQSFASGETILVVLGDRNSNIDTASAKILEGSLLLQNFTTAGVCRLSKRGVPFCKKEINLPQKLFGILTLDPETKIQQGTFKFGNEYSWLDDISLPAESLRYAWERFDSEGNFNVGVVKEPEEASDHAMTYVRLNW